MIIPIDVMMLRLPGATDTSRLDDEGMFPIIIDKSIHMHLYTRLMQPRIQTKQDWVKTVLTVDHISNQ